MNNFFPVARICNRIALFAAFIFRWIIFSSSSLSLFCFYFLLHFCTYRDENRCVNCKYEVMCLHKSKKWSVNNSMCVCVRKWEWKIPFSCLKTFILNELMMIFLAVAHTFCSFLSLAIFITILWICFKGKMTKTL